MKNTNMMKKMIALLLIVGFLVGNSPIFVFAQSNYEVTTSKGATVMTISAYNEKIWDDCLGNEINPGDYFEGDADKIEANSKVVIKAIYSSDWSMIDLLTTLPYISEIVLPLLLVNYTQEELGNFSENYKVRYALYSQWDFTDEDFEIEPDLNERIPYFKDPADYSNWLDEYNETITGLNNPLAPLLEEEDLLYYLMLTSIGILEPFANYLEELISGLDVDNASVNQRTIKLEREENDKFTIEVSYSSEGIASNIIFKNSEGEIFYHLTRNDDRWIAWTIFFSFIAVLVSSVAAIIIYRRRLKERN